MTLVDMSGEYCRADGGIGLTLSEPNFILESEPSEGISIDHNSKITDANLIREHSQKIKNAAERTINHFDLDYGFHFKIEETYPAHSGLGSGTQVALATGKSICEHAGINISTEELALIVGRGITSGIGTFAFDKGGFIVDGGYDLDKKGNVVPGDCDPTLMPQLIGRYPFPEDWNIVIAIPDANCTVTGMTEIDIFNKYCPVPQREVEKLSHMILMNLIPFMLEENIECVGQSIDEIQKLGFKKIEIELQDQKVKDLMDNLREEDCHGVGMSSFGPTIYTITDKNPKKLIKTTQDLMDGEGTVFSTKAQNSGFEII